MGITEPPVAVRRSFPLFDGASPSFTLQLSFSRGNSADVLRRHRRRLSWRILEETLRDRHAHIRRKFISYYRKIFERKGLIDSVGCLTTLEIRHVELMDAPMDIRSHGLVFSIAATRVYRNLRATVGETEYIRTYIHNHRKFVSRKQRRIKFEKYPICL